MFSRVLAAAILILIPSLSTLGNEAESVMGGESGIYQRLPDATIHTTEGAVALSTLYDQSPLILAPVFTRCAGICSPFLATLKGNLSKLNAPTDFRVLVFSFDPEDTPEDMREMAQHYELENDSQWIFGTTDQIEALTDALRFQSKWNEATRQFDHEALLAGVNAQGYIVLKLIGMQSSTDLGRLVSEIRGGFQVAFPLPKADTLFTCFSWDPVTGKARPSLGLLIMAIPALGAGLMVTGISAAARRRRKRAE